MLEKSTPTNYRLRQLKEHLNQFGETRFNTLVIALSLLLVLITYAIVSTVMLMQSKGEVDDLQSSNYSISQSNSDLEAQVDDLQSQKNELVTQIENLQTEVDSLQSELDDSTSTAASTNNIPSFIDVCGQIPSITATQQARNTWSACRVNWYKRYLPGQPIP